MQRAHAKTDDGFVLVMALLALALLGAIAATFTVNLRSHAREIAAITARAEAESLADAGITIALLDLLAAREDRTRTRRFALNGSAIGCQAGGASIEIAIADAAGRIDINGAGEQLLDALFVGSGAEPTAARAMTQALLDFRDADSIARPQGAEAPEYSAAGRPHGPKNASFDVVEELSLVLNFEPRIVERLLPHLTVHSGLAGIDPDAASPALLTMLLAGAGREPIDGADPLSLRAQFRRALPQFVAVSTGQRFAIRATARTAATAFVREATVELAGSRSRLYTVKSWRQGNAMHPAAASPAAEQPC